MAADRHIEIYNFLYCCGVYVSAESLKKLVAAVDLWQIFQFECLTSNRSIIDTGRPIKLIFSRTEGPIVNRSSEYYTAVVSMEVLRV